MRDAVQLRGEFSVHVSLLLPPPEPPSSSYFLPLHQSGYGYYRECVGRHIVVSRGLEAVHKNVANPAVDEASHHQRNL